MHPIEQLVLHYDDFAEGTERLYKALDQSKALREIFAKNPAAVVAAQMFPNNPKITKSNVSVGNRLLHSLLSNPKFEQWSRSFQASLEHQLKDAMKTDDPELLKEALLRLDRESLYKEITRGIMEFGDLETFFSILAREKGVEAPFNAQSFNVLIPTDKLLPDVAVDIEIFIYAVGAVLVFIIPVDFFFAPPTKGVTRDDLQRISNVIAVSLKQRALEVRASGELTSVRSALRE